MLIELGLRLAFDVRDERLRRASAVFELNEAMKIECETSDRVSCRRSLDPKPSTFNLVEHASLTCASPYQARSGHIVKRASSRDAADCDDPRETHCTARQAID